MEKHEIKAVFFDIGNVLVSFDWAPVLKELGWAVGTHPFKAVGLWWSGRLSDRVERGEITTREVFQMMRVEFGFEGNWGAFRKSWCGHFHANRKTTVLLRRVSRRRKVFLLSNTNRLHYEHIARRYAFVKYTEDAVLSYKLGTRKPEAEIYDTALKRAGIRPEQGLFIDDLRENVDAAVRVGMHGIWYRDAQRLEKSLEEYGVL